MYNLIFERHDHSQDALLVSAGNIVQLLAAVVSRKIAVPLAEWLLTQVLNHANDQDFTRCMRSCWNDALQRLDKPSVQSENDGKRSHEGKRPCEDDVLGDTQPPYLPLESYETTKTFRTNFLSYVNNFYSEGAVVVNLVEVAEHPELFQLRGELAASSSSSSLSSSLVQSSETVEHFGLVQAVVKVLEIVALDYRKFLFTSSAESQDLWSQNVEAELLRCCCCCGRCGGGVDIPSNHLLPRKFLDTLKKCFVEARHVSLRADKHFAEIRTNFYGTSVDGAFLLAQRFFAKLNSVYSTTRGRNFGYKFATSGRQLKLQFWSENNSSIVPIVSTLR